MNQLARFEPKTMPTPPSTTPDMDATNCATETSPKKDVQVYIYIRVVKDRNAKNARSMANSYDIAIASCISENRKRQKSSHRE